MKYSKVIINTIIEIFKQGFLLSEDVIFFIENTLGISQLEELNSILSDQKHPEYYMLIKLIFSPDDNAIFKIEPIINTTFSKENISYVIDYSFSSLKETSLIIPEGKRIFVPISKDMLEIFVNKLYLDRNIPEELVSIIQNNLPLDKFCFIKFKLRKNFTFLTKQHINFLKEFFIVFRDEREIETFFETVLNTFFDFKDIEEDIFLCFAHKKSYLTYSLRKAEQIEKMLNENNVERIITQRQNILSIDKDKILHEIFLIDEIGKRFFKRDVPILI